MGSSSSQCFLVGELRFSFGGVISGDPSQPLSVCRRLAQTLQERRSLWGFGGLDFSPVTCLTPLCVRASSQPVGTHGQQEVPRAVPSRCSNLKYAVKQRPGFVSIFLLYCLLLYKRLQFKINRSDSQLMWYSGRPEFLLLWQWSSAHLFCR